MKQEDYPDKYGRKRKLRYFNGETPQHYGIARVKNDQLQFNNGYNLRDNKNWHSDYRRAQVWINPPDHYLKRAPKGTFIINFNKWHVKNGRKPYVIKK